MRGIKKIAVLAIMMSTVLYAAQDQAWMDSALRGKELYKEYCLNCHGPKGAGDTKLGQMLGNVTDLSDPMMKEKSDENLLQSIKGNSFHAFEGDTFSDEELQDLLNFVRYLAM